MSTIVVDALSETEAMLLVDEIKARFGWAGCLVTRHDAELSVAFTEQPRLSDQQWMWVRSSILWTEGLRDTMLTATHDLLSDIVFEAFMVTPETTRWLHGDH